MELVQQQYMCGVFREREKKNLLQWNLCSSSRCVVCLEKEKKKIFCNETCAAAFFIEYFNDHLYILSSIFYWKRLKRMKMREYNPYSIS
jgi:hypothetical protein